MQIGPSRAEKYWFLWKMSKLPLKLKLQFDLHTLSSLKCSQISTNWDRIMLIAPTVSSKALVLQSDKIFERCLRQRGLILRPKWSNWPKTVTLAYPLIFEVLYVLNAETYWYADCTFSQVLSSSLFCSGSLGRFSN